MNKKVVLVTGGSKGIGLAVTKMFLKKNYFVIDASRTKSNAVKNKKYIFVKTDVSKEKEVKALFGFIIKKFCKLDIPVNNAGFGRFGTLLDSKTKDYDDLFNVNVKGLYLCTRYALEIMVTSNKGDIVNISSIAGKNAIPNATLYSASKHAVMGLSKSLMLEVRNHNIRVSVICPGSVDTNFFDGTENVLTADRRTIISPDDIADSVWFAVSSNPRAVFNEIEVRPANPIQAVKK